MGLRSRIAASTCRFVAALALASSLVAFPSTASAQYFGRNKVKYESFDFKVLTTPHFDVLFYLEDEKVIEDAARMAERWYERYARLFQHEFRGPKSLILYADHPDFQQSNALSGQLGEGTAGITESFKDRIVVLLTDSRRGTDRLIGHELVHEFQSDMAQSRSGPGARGLSNVALWLNEGLADYLSVGREDPHAAMWLREAIRRDAFPDLASGITADRLYTHHLGHAFWAFIGGTFGDEVVADIYRRATRAGMNRALGDAVSRDVTGVASFWRSAMEAEYLPLMAGKEAPGESGALLFAPSTGAGRQSLSPSVSPDGQLVAFLSERGESGVNLFLADARTGQVLRTLVSTAVDPHFDALRFVESQGDWSPDGSRFVFTMSSEGDDELAIVNVATGDVAVRGHFGEIAIAHPAWSPDGRSIVFSGLNKGSSDLYQWEYHTGDLDKLTDDPFSALQPTWSPDGATIAFVTDRGPVTDFERLEYGEPHIAFLDIASGDISALDVFENAKHINPRYAPDGRSLYFISDQDGFSDIYQYTLSDGEIRRITRLQTGVTGSSAMSPAISVARDAGTLIYSVFDDFEFHIYSLQSNEVDAEGREVTAASGPRPGRLLSPALPDKVSRVAGYLADPVSVLVPDGTFLAEGTQAYKPIFSMDFTGQPDMGSGTDRFATYSAGGATLYYSDLLGNHKVGITGQVVGHLKDVGGQVHYMNESGRLSWGLTAGWTPHRQGYVTQGWHDPTDQIRLAVSRQHTFLKHGGIVLGYPFSSTLRVESNVGIQHYSYSLEEDVTLVGQAGTWAHNSRLQFEDWLDPVTLGAATLALVSDRATEGYTSPTSGTRFRLEVGRSFGVLNFTSLVADFRGYDSPTGSLTLAVRALHFGRYGGGLDPTQNDGQMQPLALGYEPLMRGYSFESYDVIRECDLDVEQGARATACDGFARLFGHRLAVANFEVRTTLLGTPEQGLIIFPFLPTELFAFADAGVAWNDLENLDFRESVGDEKPIFSVGGGIRTNFAGFLVLETYVAYPFQRGKGAHVGWVLSPGW